jgi:hypothetical protein
MIDEKQGFLYLIFTIFIIALVGYFFDKKSKASKKKKREKDIKDYLDYLKDNNYKFYEYYKNPHNRDKTFYLKSAMYQATKGFKVNEKVSQYARDNNLTNIPIKEVKKIMKKNKVSY